MTAQRKWVARSEVSTEQELSVTHDLPPSDFLEKMREQAERSSGDEDHRSGNKDSDHARRK